MAILAPNRAAKRAADEVRESQVKAGTWLVISKERYGDWHVRSCPGDTLSSHWRPRLPFHTDQRAAAVEVVERKFEEFTA